MEIYNTKDEMPYQSDEMSQVVPITEFEQIFGLVDEGLIDEVELLMKNDPMIQDEENNDVRWSFVVSFGFWSMLSGSNCCEQVQAVAAPPPHTTSSPPSPQTIATPPPPHTTAAPPPPHTTATPPSPQTTKIAPTFEECTFVLTPGVTQHVLQGPVVHQTTIAVEEDERDQTNIFCPSIVLQALFVMMLMACFNLLVEMHYCLNACPYHVNLGLELHWLSSKALLLWMFVMCRTALAWSSGHDSRRLEVKADGDNLKKQSLLDHE
ncbi:hypothetical protein KIW84_043809 [Lathyrus oleraceus]|uniref:Uncharacterized protein n=1 Tax=Pisum sativum TaxID=3888 RepID=A0A9D4XJ05_PEA|nr:hypothetical protein KIW84_043809 [Pisum sativum]